MSSSFGLVDRAPRHLFFTGKGGVGKTSVASATALALAERGRRVLLVSTDPASNLDEVLATPLGRKPAPIASVAGLYALNLDPAKAALAYREKVVGPYRAVLPPSAIQSIEEQLAGACTVEIAAFDEFARLLGDPQATGDFDHVVFDTAPTGHTLRLLELPSAWTGFLDANVGGTSCLGPLTGLKEQRDLYERTRRALCDSDRTVVVLVSRPERAALAEAERARSELNALGMQRMELVLNGLFVARETQDPLALTLEARGRAALESMPQGLAKLLRCEVPLLPFGLVGVDALRAMFGTGSTPPRVKDVAPLAPATETLDALVDALAAHEHGVVLTMGKGGVGKTSVAVAIARRLSARGRRVHLTTTDPAAHLDATLGGQTGEMRVSRIDPAVEVRAYSDQVLATTGAGLDAAGRALLEEDLRSPCTEEIAVFRAFARVVDEGERGFVVIDTAPTGHTLLLLDAAESYHREVLRKTSGVPEEVRRLLPRLRDPAFTHVVLVTLPEATPVHEAAALARDLARADIRPFAWIVNQCLTPLTPTDPVLVERRAAEARRLAEVAELAPRTVVLPWRAEGLE